MHFSPSLDILLDQGNPFDGFSGGFRSGEKGRASFPEIFELEADGAYIPLEIFFARAISTIPLRFRIFRCGKTVIGSVEEISPEADLVEVHVRLSARITNAD